MNIYKFNIYILFIFLLSISKVYSQQDSSKYGNLNFKYNLGLNTNFILASENYEMDFTGWGLFFEPHITSKLSVVLSYNSLKIMNKKNSVRHADLNSTQSSIVIRYRIINDIYSVFPEIGFGRWGGSIGCFMIGAGSDYNLSKELNTAISIDYSYAYDKILDVGGGSWANNFIKVNFSISYQFYISKKIKLKNKDKGKK